MSVVLYPTKDDFINSYTPAITYNTTGIEVYNGGVGDSIYGLLKFDLSGIIGKQIESAKLKLYAISLTTNTTISIQRITSSWTEGVVTYATAPSKDATVYYSGMPSPGEGWKEIDIANLVQSIADGAVNEGIWLSVGNPTDEYRWCKFSSKEGDHVPELVMSYKESYLDEFAVQEALVSAFTSSTTLSNLVGGRIYTYPIVNAAYPYIQFGSIASTNIGTHDKRGSDTTHYINIFTKPDMLGYYPIKNILREIESILDYKNISLIGAESITISKAVRDMTDVQIDGEYINGTAKYRILAFEK